MPRATNCAKTLLSIPGYGDEGKAQRQQKAARSQTGFA